jgi:hypothetical protein
MAEEKNAKTVNRRRSLICREGEAENAGSSKIKPK